MPANRFEFTDMAAYVAFIAGLQAQGLAFHGGDTCGGAILWVVITGH